MVHKHQSIDHSATLMRSLSIKRQNFAFMHDEGIPRKRRAFFKLECKIKLSVGPTVKPLFYARHDHIKYNNFN